MAMSLTFEDKEWIVGQIQQSEGRIADRLSEKMEGMETRILSAFHIWASPMEARVDSHSMALRALDIGYEALRDRVKKLEEK
jgi:hypothetical protein